MPWVFYLYIVYTLDRMKYFRKSRGGRNYRKRGVAKATYKRRVSKSVKRFVKQAIHRQIENKEAIQYGVNQTIPNAQAGGSNPVGIALLPYISGGTGPSNRIGNQIKVRSGIVKGHVNLLPYDSVTNATKPPCYVKMWLLRDLKYNFQQAVANLNYAGFFNINNSSVGLQGNMLDMSFPVNPDAYRVLASKIVKLGTTYTNSLGSITTSSYHDNSQISVPFWFNWGKFCKKTLKYADPVVLDPMNESCYLIFQVVSADGTALGGNFAEYHFVNTCKYEDA